MTDIATRPTNGNGPLVINRRDLVLPPVSDDFIEAYPGLSPALDLDAALEAALGPNVKLRLSDLTRVKVPSAELTRLMVPSATDDELMPTAELVGLPVGQTARRSWWPTRVITHTPPACASRDLVHGVGAFGLGSEDNPSGLCDDCPMSRIGSADTGTNASACKEQRLVFLLTDAEILPLMVVVPAGSLQAHKAMGLWFMKKGIAGHLRGVTESGVQVRGLPWSAIELGIGLEQTKNPAGQDYNRYTFKSKRRLSPDERAVVDAYAMYVEELIAEQAETLDALAADNLRAAQGDDDAAVYGAEDPDDGDDLADGVEMPPSGKAARAGK